MNVVFRKGQSKTIMSWTGTHGGISGILKDYFTAGKMNVYEKLNIYIVEMSN